MCGGPWGAGGEGSLFLESLLLKPHGYNIGFDRCYGYKGQNGGITLPPPFPNLNKNTAMGKVTT